MANLFDKAKKSAPAKAAKKDEKVRISVKDSTFFEKVETLESLQDTMSIAKAKADMLADELKDLGKDEWTKLYEKTGKNPGSVMLEQRVDGSVAQLMFIPTDKYITLNEDRATELTETYGDDIITEKTVFSFDNEMIEKYGEILSRLIEECDEIDTEDRGKIIKASTTYSVAKGTIDQMKSYGGVYDVMESIRPVIAIKNVSVIKG